MSNEKRKLMVDIDILPIHQQIRVKRVAEGLTQTQLVELLGLPDVPFLSRIETGEKPIPKWLETGMKRYLYEEVYKDGQLQKNVG
ncbi:helix-turn-helix domain-containing protein [Bacillus cereus]|uniref:helix-turn-helix domain-containing protein n=1 Tax=Bacillus cereus TaxID=1396 RepID=UPI001E55C117|nr:helix-turn-helix transcriptional regulator [Bacillus cereus]MCC2397716.1 helix-turn-helix domain-containing protein [Bacillus cereus]